MTNTRFGDHGVGQYRWVNMPRAIAAIGLLCLATHVEANEPAPPTSRELYSCENEAERFKSWASIAGRLDPDRVKADRVKIIEVHAGDGRTIRGVAAMGDAPRKNAVLVIGGNAWSAKPFLSSALEFFTPFNADIYYFDFRGYGMSTPANPTMNAILEDYRDIAKWLLKQGHDRLYLYGFSFGGVIALVSFPDLSPFERVVIDSAPSRASDFGFKCKPTYETVDFVPGDCRRLTLMHGTDDWVMPRPKVSELIESVKKCGAGIDIDVWRGHPFQAEWDSSRKARAAAVMNHLGIEETAR